MEGTLPPAWIRNVQREVKTPERFPSSATLPAGRDRTLSSFPEPLPPHLLSEKQLQVERSTPQTALPVIHWPAVGLKFRHYFLFMDIWNGPWMTFFARVVCIGAQDLDIDLESELFLWVLLDL